MHNVQLVEKANTSTDSHIIEECQITYFSETGPDPKVQTGPAVICVESGPNESQGCLCQVEGRIIATDRCSTVYLQHPTTKGSNISCHEKQPKNLKFEFSCQIQKADRKTDRSCKCLEAQQSWVEDYLQRNDNPFIENIHHASAEILWEQELDQMRYLPHDEIEAYHLEPTMSFTVTETYMVTEVITLDTVSLDESHVSSEVVPGFYIIPKSFPQANPVEATHGIVKGVGSAREPTRKVPLTDRFVLQANHLLGTLSHFGNLQKSLKSRALDWVDMEYQSCMEKACDQNEYGKKPEKVCSDNLTNMDKLTRQNCRMCSPINPQMLAEHCRQLVIKEKVALYTVCGMAFLLALVAMGLVALRRWRRLHESREQEFEEMPDKLNSNMNKKRWYRLSRNSGARKVPGTDQAETGSSPEKLTMTQPLVNGTPAMRERVPIMPHAHIRGSPFDGVGTDDQYKEAADATAAAVPVVPRIRITSTGSQHSTSHSIIQRKTAQGSDQPGVLDCGSLND